MTEAMTEQEIKLECLKLAAPLVSSSVDNRIEEIKRAADALYKYVFSDTMQDMDTPRRGRPPKPRTI